MKKLFLLLFILGVLGAGGWYYYDQTKVVENTPDARGKTLTKITNSPVISPVTSTNLGAIWYGSENGRMMRFDLTTQTATEYPMPKIEGNAFSKIYWPLIGSDFITAQETAETMSYSYFDSETNVYTPLPKNVLNVDWMGNNTKVAIVWKSGDGKTYLVTSNPDASGYTIIRELPWSDVAIKASPTSNKALIYRDKSTDPVNKLYLFDLDTREYLEVTTDGRVTGADWSPTGNAIVYTKLEDDKHQVYFRELSEAAGNPIGLATTFDKVSFDRLGENLYISATSLELKKEEIWKYSVASKSKAVIFSSDTLQVHNIFAIGEKLFFQGPDNVLYSYQ